MQTDKQGLNQTDVVDMVTVVAGSQGLTWPSSGLGL